MSLHGVAKRVVLQHTVVVFASDAFDLEKAAFLQIADDPLNRSFGDPDVQCNVSQDEIRIRVEDREDVSMVGEKRPLRRVLQLQNTAIHSDGLGRGSICTV